MTQPDVPSCRDRSRSRRSQRSSCPTARRRTRWRRPTACGVSDLLWLDGPPRTPADGEDRDGAFDLEPPPGGLSLRIISIPAAAPRTRPTTNVGSASPAKIPSGRACTPPTRSTSWPCSTARSSSASTTASTISRQGDCVVQRGNAHRWRVVGDRPCTYAVVMVRPVASSGPSRSRSSRPRPGRRARGAASSPGPTPTAGPPRSSTAPRPSCTSPAGPGGVSLVELWQTGGPLRDPGQGGDPRGLVAARAAQRGHRVPRDRDAGRVSTPATPVGTPPTRSTSTS